MTSNHPAIFFWLSRSTHQAEEVSWSEDWKAEVSKLLKKRGFKEEEEGAIADPWVTHGWPWVGYWSVTPFLKACCRKPRFEVSELGKRTAGRNRISFDRLGNHWIPWKLAATGTFFEPSQVWNITRPMPGERRLPSRRSWRTKVQHWSQSTSQSAFIWRPPMSLPLIWTSVKIGSFSVQMRKIEVYCLYSSILKIFNDIQSYSFFFLNLFNLFYHNSLAYFRQVIFSFLGRWLRWQGPGPIGGGTQIIQIYGLDQSVVD